ncbi:hypothetical protein [Alkalihalobacillus sp. CinArs1]|uniref:hypothetical protein n=1 Tax=Alkalihalobacillus sp. CinArs1 TaxID=2995314 RepID=UPI0022DE3DA3|nr:hypothetical protein [Alkalihalobacillus sp. CinArs1]
MQTFVECQTKVIDLVQNNRYDQSLEVMEEAKTQFSEKRDRLGHWKANVYCLQGKTKEAIGELQSAIDNGFWWNPEILTTDPELSLLKETEGFKRIIDQCETLFHENLKEAESLLKVDGNPNAEVSVMSLHWKGSNVKDFSLEWKDDRILNKYHIAFPQSSQLFSYGCFSWDDPKQTQRDVEEMTSQFLNQHVRGQKPVILSGASQGGGRAVELALEKGEFEYFIAVVPAFEDLAKLEKLAIDSKSNVRGCVITGDQDPFYETALKAVSLLRKHSVPCKLIVKEGMGHTFPQDLPKVFEEAVRFVLE